LESIFIEDEQLVDCGTTNLNNFVEEFVSERNDFVKSDDVMIGATTTD
jgi:hypothetical protein